MFIIRLCRLVSSKVKYYILFVSGHVATVPLPRTLGRQPLRFGRAAVPHIPAVSHLRALYALSVDSRAGLLRTSGGIPRALPPRREGARLRRG